MKSLLSVLASVFILLVIGAEHADSVSSYRPALLWSNGCSPWGNRDNYIQTCNKAWGAGKWDMFTYQTPLETIFASTALYIEGSESCTDELKTWVDANNVALANYIRNGGRVWINFATNEIFTPFCLGLSGICTERLLSKPLDFIDPPAPFLAQPFPVVDHYDAYYCSHNSFTGGPDFVPLTYGSGESSGDYSPVGTVISMGQQYIGKGLLMVSGFTAYTFWNPTDSALNLNANILVHVNTPENLPLSTVRLEHDGKVLLTPAMLIRAGLDLPVSLEILPLYVSCQDVETKVTITVNGYPVAQIYVKDTPHSGCSDGKGSVAPGKDEVKH